MLARTSVSNRFWLCALALGAAAVVTACQQANPDTQAAGASELTSTTSVKGWVTDCQLDYLGSSTGIVAARFHDESTSGDSLNVSSYVGDAAQLPYVGFADASWTSGVYANATAFIANASHANVAESDLNFQLADGISLVVHTRVDPFEYQGGTYTIAQLICNVTPKSP